MRRAACAASALLLAVLAQPAARAAGAQESPAGSPGPGRPVGPPAGAPNADAPAAEPAEGDDAEAVLLDLAIGREVSRTVPAFRRGDRALVPLAALLDLAEVGHEVRAGGAVEARLEPGAVRLAAGPRSDSLIAGRRAIPLPPRLRLLRDGELYVDAEALGDALGVHVAVSWASLLVVLDGGELPVVRRLARERARARLAERGAADGPGSGADARPPLERPRLDGVVMDYTLSTPISTPGRGAAYALALGANVFGGALEGALASDAAGGGGARGEGSWTGVWRDARWLRQLRLGDGYSTGPRPRAVLGVALTNAPFLRRAEFGAALYPASFAGSGWSLEAYREGRLVAFDSADAFGNAGLRLPVQYGQNPVDLVAYGPHGEVRTFNRTFLVPETLLPARRAEYGLTAGACRDPACAAAANADLRYGITSRWTARAGVEAFRRDTLPARTHPYAGVTGAVTNALSLDLDAAARALARAGVHYEPSTDARLDGDYTRFSDADASPVVVPAGWRSRWALSAFLRPPRARAGSYFDVRAEGLRTVRGTTTGVRLGGSVRSDAVHLMPYVRLERVGTPGVAAATARYGGADVFVMPRPSWGALLGQAWIRAVGEADDGARPSRWALSVARPLPAAGLRAEAGAAWVRGVRGATYSVVLTADRAALRSFTTVTRAGDAPAVATQSVQGSVLWDGSRRRASFVRGPSLLRGGVSGRVFLDGNGNGVFDDGDVPLPDVQVRMGSTAGVTDSAGRVTMWGVTPYEPVPVQVDSLTLASPLWVPGHSVVDVQLGPNRFQPLDIPIVPGGEVEGRVVRERAAAAGGVPLRSGVAGASLTLTDRRTGARRALVTFNDGGFSAIGVRPGEYDVAVDPQLLARLDARCAPVRVVVRAIADGDRVSGIELVLVAAPAPPRPPPGEGR